MAGNYTNYCSCPRSFAITRVVLFLFLSLLLGASMDAHLQTHLSAAALVVAILALFFSLVAAFPGLKGILAAVRDGVLWFALFLVIGGVGFVVWQRLQQAPGFAAAGSTQPAAAADSQSSAGDSPTAEPR